MPLRRLALLAGALVLVALVSGCAIGFRAPATNITSTSATLNGAVESNRSESGTWWFKYGTTTSYGSETPHRSITFIANQKQAVSEPLTGLTAATSYHYRLCAQDQDPNVGANCSADQTFTTCTPGAAGCGWQQGEMRTFDQFDWGESSTAVGTLLNTHFGSVFGSGLIVGGDASMLFTTASAVFNYLPAIGSLGVLTGGLLNPITSSAGEFGGQVVALTINVEFSAANLLANTTPLGGLRFCNFTQVPVLNGQTVSQFLATANTMLGGGSGPVGVATASGVAGLINGAFLNGTPSVFAQTNLVNGACP